MCDGVQDGEDADHLDQPAAERSLANPLHVSTSEAVATRHDGGNGEPPLPQAGHTQRTPNWDKCLLHAYRGVLYKAKRQQIDNLGSRRIPPVSPGWTETDGLSMRLISHHGKLLLEPPDIANLGGELDSRRIQRGVPGGGRASRRPVGPGPRQEAIILYQQRS